MVDSLLDFDVILRNREVFNIVKKLPYEVVQDFFGKVINWEKPNILTDRWLGYKDKVLDTMKVTHIVGCDPDRLAGQWADYMTFRYADLARLLIYLSDDRFLNERVHVQGKRFVDDAIMRGTAPLLVSTHMGPYSSIPTILSRLGYQIATFMDNKSVDVWTEMITAFAPELVERIYPIPLPNKWAVRAAAKHLRNGRLCLIMPEFSLGERPDATTTFLGREVYTPLGTARIASLLQVPLIPVTVTKESEYDYLLAFEEPLYHPEMDISINEITDDLFRWIESKVLDNPGNWWCWEIFNDTMVVCSND